MTRDDKRDVQGALNFLTSVADANKSAHICLVEVGGKVAATLAGNAESIADLVLSASEDKDEGGRIINEVLQLCFVAKALEDVEFLNVTMAKLDEIKQELNKEGGDNE